MTLADVARRARVSPATASRVINGSNKPVADGLRERVLKAVADLRYVPNAHAQNLARAQRSAVGVIVHDVSDPYFAEITRGLQRVASSFGQLLVICNSYREPERELAYVALLRAQQVHALILAGSGYHDDAFTERLNAELGAYQQAGGRVAVIGRHRLVGSAVLPANEDGAYALGLRVFGLGHRRVAIIAGPRWLTTTTDRLTGFRRAAEEGDEGARVALELISEPARFLSTVQIGITLVGILMGVVAGDTIADALAGWLQQFEFLARYAQPIGLGTVVVMLTFLSLVIGELLPKALALNHPERIASAMARPMRAIAIAANPAVKLLSWTTNMLRQLVHWISSPTIPRPTRIFLPQPQRAWIIWEGSTVSNFSSAGAAGKMIMRQQS